MKIYSPICDFTPPELVTLLFSDKGKLIIEKVFSHYLQFKMNLCRFSVNDLLYMIFLYKNYYIIILNPYILIINFIIYNFL